MRTGRGREVSSEETGGAAACRTLGAGRLERKSEFRTARWMELTAPATVSPRGPALVVGIKVVDHEDIGPVVSFKEGEKVGLVPRRQEVQGDVDVKDGYGVAREGH